jgi:SAM-dependent methyltransferase
MSDVANAAQRELWNAQESRHWVTDQDRFDRMLAPFGERVLDAAAPERGEAVLDVGCGTGAMTCGAARRARTATGVDISVQMVEAARARAAGAGPANETFEVADAQTHPFRAGAVDVAVSRFGVMFFDRPVAAFTNLRHALRPGGRMVFVCWQGLAANEWMSVPLAAALTHVPAPPAPPPGAPGAFSLGDRDHVRAVLRDAGFRAVEADPVAAPVAGGGGGTIDDAMRFFRNSGASRSIFADADPEVVERALAAVRTALEPHAGPGGVRLDGACWLVSAHAP